jgi:hypothetical protein
MAEKLNLNRYKSSGVYTVEIDESTNLSLPLSTGRLVIGSSKKGPINSVVLVNDLRTLSAVYGDIDSKLEKNGNYFHRTIQVALRNGPVYALNLLPIADSDVAYFTTFNTEAASNNSTWSASSYKSSIADFYNTQKLWFADVDAVNKYKNLALGDSFPATGTVDKDANKLLSLVNLSKKPVTAWARIADTTGYDIKVKEYYKLLGDKVEVPEFLHPDDYIADYFVELAVVEGDWSDALRLSKDPIYQQYFNASGIILSKLNDFLSLKEVTVVNRTIGAIIPDFRDLAGSPAALDHLFNNKFSTSGVYCALDYKKIDMIDLLNNPVFDGGPGSPENVETQRLDLVGYGFDEIDSQVYSVDSGNPDLGIEPVKLIDVLSYKKTAGYKYYFNIPTTSPDNYDILPGAALSLGEMYTVNPTGSDNNYIIATIGSPLYNAWANGFIKTGDTLLTGSTRYLSTDGVIKTVMNGMVKVSYIEFYAYSDLTYTNQVDAAAITSGSNKYLHIVSSTSTEFNIDFDLTDTDIFMPGFNYFAPNQLVVTLTPTLYGNPAKKETPNTNAPYNADARGDIDNFIKTGQYVKARVLTDGDGNPVIRERLLKIKTVYAKKVSVTYLGDPTSTLQYTITVDSPLDTNITGIDLTDSILKVYKGIKNYVTDLTGFYVPAMSLDETGLYPNGTSTRQNKILDYMFENTNIASTIADNETLNFRYIIDSFEGQIAPASKQQLAQLAANHGKALAICNAPSFAQYEKSIDPSFIDFNTNLVSTEYISTGGNLSSNPEFTFGFASGDKNGIAIASYAAYFMPNLVIFDNGRSKSVPPAAYIANTYMKKYTGGNTFSIVAGKRGIITEPEVTGLEYDLTNDDRDYLEPVGFNMIVRRRGFGVMIFSNNTGYQRVKSALNNIHVREALVTIERDIERILLNYLFEFNDPTTRLRVKTLVKNYLEAVQDARGIATFDVIFDDSNNGSEVLENNAGVIDIIVDFPRGIQKFINRITITRAGGQLASASTGFTPSF